MKSTNAMVATVIKSFYTLTAILALSVIVSSCGDDSDDEDEKEFDCAASGFEAAVTKSETEFSFTITNGDTPYKYSIAYEGVEEAQEGTSEEKTFTAEVKHFLPKATITITDANDCTLTKEVAAFDCATESDFAVEAIGSDGEIRFTITGGKAPYSYSVTHEGVTEPFTGEKSEKEYTVVTEQTSKATVVVTDAYECTKTIEISADDMSSFVDTRDGQRYKMETIGTQTWLAENFNYDYEGSRCYGDDASNCETYGKLYDWDIITSDDFAPEGWKMPTIEEAETLETFLGSIAGNSGAKLKEGGTSGFEAKLAGQYNIGFKYADLEEYGYFWTGTEHNTTEGKIFSVESGDSAIGIGFGVEGDKTSFFSVRFIKE
ncbi:FISUMP domain-containing protein [Reichenbachiella versicolor]|uniref:FISUMP domain-containing protein n=1 Tax=Reichenbachiella versicolor TaxID=1821036 RepID=UPI000D6DFE4D|nr:FISUMP domain-containing protein [Reichenbachiella versicolor]